MSAKHSYILFYLLLLYSFRFRFIVSAMEICSPSLCHAKGPEIRFPFGLKGLRNVSCGYQGFDLLCGANDQTLVELPGSGQFVVREINYHKQELIVSDPNNCLPLRLLSLNLSASPFTGGSKSRDLTFFNCSFADHDSESSKLKPISCLSGSNFTVFATFFPRVAEVLRSSEVCNVVKTVSVLLDFPVHEEELLSEIGSDLRLGWEEPNCRMCEFGRGRCALKNSTTREIECISGQPHELPKSTQYAISIAAVIPVTLFAIWILCYIFGRVKSCQGDRTFPIAETPSVNVMIRETKLANGLDGPTIASYPKTILGDSCRLPKPGQDICPICLFDYKPNETMRSIPECQHYFHVDCIDEWLYLNATCPVCRNSLDQSPLTELYSER